MFYPNKPFFKSVFLLTLFLFPIAKAASNDLPQQVNQLQTRLKEANEKIAMLASDQQRTAQTITALESRLNATNQEISELNNSGGGKPNQVDATNAGIRRAANGHGRGGR